MAETAGEVVRYQENIAVTYYYSTSCGRTTNMEAWGGAPGDGNAYLQSVQVCGNEGDYEKDLPWYHWRAEIGAETLAGLIGGYANKSLGTLENVEVTKRGWEMWHLNLRRERKIPLLWRRRTRSAQRLEAQAIRSPRMTARWWTARGHAQCVFYDHKAGDTYIIEGMATGTELE